MHGHRLPGGPRGLGRALGRSSRLRRARVALGQAFVLLAATLLFISLPRVASAHQVGVSRGDYAARGAHLDAHIALSRRDLSSTIPGIDADGDGALSQAELDTRRSDVERIFSEKTVVREGDAPCPGSLVSARLEDPDGVAVDVVFDCPSPAPLMSIELGFLAALGPGHRHLAHASGAGAPIDDLYYRGKALIELPVTFAPERSSSVFAMGGRRALAAMDPLVFLFGLLLLTRRSRDVLVLLASFAVGSSLTLALSEMAALSPSPRVLAAATALSVLYIGVDDVFAKDTSYRWAVALSFGGIHGFALSSFARAAPNETGLSFALAGAGALLALLAVAAIVGAVLSLVRKRRWFDPWARSALSVLVAIAGVARLALALSRA